MSKILLIAPPFYRLMGSHYNGLDLGLSYIAAFLKKHGHEAVIYNADFYNDSHYLDQRKLFANFDHYKATLNDDNHPIWREVGSAIKSFDPDIIGIQVYTGTYKNAQNVAFIAKAFNPEIKVIAGGTHPSLDPEGTLGCRAYDYACRGEGEYTMLEIASGKDPAGIKGLTYRGKNGRVINNEERPFITDLDALPFPERSGFFVGDGNIDTGAIITSRGCPFRCAYCASPKIWKRKVRYRGVGNVLDELEHMIKKDKVSLVRFQDDTFTLNKTRACAI
ncbi:MAG: cobalamin-dependent protein, partial [Candidatus Omnitrophota bacterium]